MRTTENIHRLHVIFHHHEPRRKTEHSSGGCVLEQLVRHTAQHGFAAERPRENSPPSLFDQARKVPRTPPRSSSEHVWLVTDQNNKKCGTAGTSPNDPHCSAVSKTTIPDDHQASHLQLQHSCAEFFSNLYLSKKKKKKHVQQQSPRRYPSRVPMHANTRHVNTRHTARTHAVARSCARCRCCRT